MKLSEVGIGLCIFSILFTYQHCLAIREQKVEICLSAVTGTQFRSFLNFFEFGENVVEVEITPTQNQLMNDGFTWGDSSEDSQMGACLDWLNKIIRIPDRKVMRSVVNKRSLLNFSAGNYVLKGTTDIIIFPKKYEDNINLRGGIQIMIELKNKKPSEADRRQAVLQLITASFCSIIP